MDYRPCPKASLDFSRLELVSKGHSHNGSPAYRHSSPSLRGSGDDILVFATFRYRALPSREPVQTCRGNELKLLKVRTGEEARNYCSDIAFRKSPWSADIYYKDANNANKWLCSITSDPRLPSPSCIVSSGVRGLLTCNEARSNPVRQQNVDHFQQICQKSYCSIWNWVRIYFLD